MHAEVKGTFRDRYSWPLGITLMLALFMGMTVFFVKKAFSERVDLVAVDYYYRDKLFSEKLRKQKKLAMLGASGISRSGNGIAINLPDFFARKKIKGSLYFYSPLNPADDFSVPVNFSGNKTLVDVRTDAARKWRVSFDFSSGPENYFLESAL